MKINSITEKRNKRPKLPLHKRIGSDVNITRIGLNAVHDNFYLNNEEFKILSGEIHYFRIPKSHWRHRLKALKAVGLNTVSTYIAWNVHEPIKNTYNFIDNYDIETFLDIATELDLKVIIRIGPYICAEWEWGGLPAWLLQDPDMEVRSNYQPYQEAVEKWITYLAEILRPYQYTHVASASDSIPTQEGGGPIIAFQLENEYGSYPDKDNKHLPFIRDLLLRLGLNELHYTCDDSKGLTFYSSNIHNKLSGVLAAINSQENIQEHINELKSFQPHQPVFIAEYWVGWFDWWGDKRHNLGFPWKNKFDLEMFSKTTKEILDLGASFNVFMFAGGTNFGFYNGGIYQGNTNKRTYDTTSYDYTAPVSESGKLTEKYYELKKILREYKTKGGQDDDDDNIPDPSPLIYIDYGKVEFTKHLPFRTYLDLAYENRLKLEKPKNIENLPINNHNGQYYGYVVYETEVIIAEDRSLKIDARNNIRDRAIVYLNNGIRGEISNSEPVLEVKNAGAKRTKQTLTLLVENQGRLNWVMPTAKKLFNDQRKGIIGDILINDEVQSNWKIWPIEFDTEKFFNNFLNHPDTKKELKDVVKMSNCPAIFFATINIRKVGNTFLNFHGWDKGVAFVNGRNIGRYNKLGPQRTLFVPGEFLRSGKNNITIFEESNHGLVMRLQDDHILE